MTKTQAKCALLATSCLATVLVAMPALAQQAAPAQESAAVVEEVVVTGSRITSGFSAPTPVTVTSAEDLKAAAPRNLAEGLAQLPTFSGSALTANNGTATGASAGQSLLNLRGLGSNRNLILLDGRRLPPTNVAGSVDVNLIPQSLVSRVDVVTGGASAAYGSDAVAGVVNFILDTRFQGIKGEIQFGESGYNDVPQGSGSLSFGKWFLDGRARMIGAVEYSKTKGIDADELTGRSWFDVAKGRIPNPVAGAKPSTVLIDDIRRSNGSYGGLITSGPLKGQQFLPGGALGPFALGSPVGTAFMSGGDGPRANIAFTPTQSRGGAFWHGEYDISDSLMAFGEVQYFGGEVESGNAVQVQVGAGNQFTIFRDNAFLSPAVLAQLGTTQSFTMGRSESEFPLRTIKTTLQTGRFAAGLKGDIGAWTWDASYSYGKVNQKLGDNKITINRRLYAAVDAVRAPNGQIVCRSTLSGYDPGCIPLNLFGVGAPSAAAIDWVTGDSTKWVELTQSVAQANLSGDFGERLQLWAGPISFATGLEYRKETADQTVDPLSQVVTEFTGVRGFPASQQNRPGGYAFSNPLPLAGEYSVKEGYVELGVPVVKDLAFAQSLDLTLAARHADYSLSGGVTTWKYGFNWQVVPDVRLRYTKSRDIRGPNILELFNSASQTSNNQVYFGQTLPALLITSGNPDLKPEEGTTDTYGVVYRPSWAEGLTMSIDYYGIVLEGAIGNIANVIQRCEQGSTQACGLITLTPSNTLIIKQQVVNLAVTEVAGYDYEVAYVRSLGDGRLTVRLLGNHGTVDETQNFPTDPPTRVLGETGSPEWRNTLTVRYSTDKWSLSLQERFISEALADATEVEGVDTTLNSVPAYQYTSVGGTYKLGLAGGEHELFFNINNLFDKDPPVVVGNPTTYSSPTSNAYDRIGRYYTVGLRFRW